MDFFAAQDQARQRSVRYMWLFAVAVLLITLAVYIAVSAGFKLYDFWSDPRVIKFAWWSLPRFLISTGATWMVILSGCIAKMSELRRGGVVVAQMLRGHRVKATAQNPQWRQLLGVVEEMAIASGVPVPELFILEHERGINAFAAGQTLDDAVIAVSQGALDMLDRNELQGIVAHEFSHILNGDMRLNTRLIGILHGILSLTILGRLLREPFGGDGDTMAFGGSRGPRGGFGGGGFSGGGKLGLVLVVVVVVAALVTVIGYIGAFFARRIQRVVLREREYGADAAAVQFTRYPAGLVGALKKVGGLRNGSHIRAARTEEAAHLFFSNPICRLR